MGRYFFPFSGFGMLNWIISTVGKRSVLVGEHVVTFWVYKFQHVIPLANLPKIRPNFQKWRKDQTKIPFWKRPNFHNLVARKQVPSPGLKSWGCGLDVLWGGASNSWMSGQKWDCAVIRDLLIPGKRSLRDCFSSWCWRKSIIGVEISQISVVNCTIHDCCFMKKT